MITNSLVIREIWMAKILAFDTATVACSVALWCDGVASMAFEIAPRRHGELLLTMIDRLLNAQSIKVSDCDAIAFGNGPGSFMGLRIAAGVAQGLAFAANIPVIPVSTLQALAQAAYWETNADNILVGWDARMHQIYWGAYRCEDHRMKVIVSDQLTAPADVQLSAGDWLAAGNAWSVYSDLLPASVAHLPKPEQDCYPTAKAVAFLAADLLVRGEGIAPEAIELSYLRNKVAVRPSPRHL